MICQRIGSLKWGAITLLLLLGGSVEAFGGGPWVLSTPGEHTISGFQHPETKQHVGTLSTIDGGKIAKVILVGITDWTYYDGHVLFRTHKSHLLLNEAKETLVDVGADVASAEEAARKTSGSERTSVWIPIDKGWALTQGWPLLMQRIAEKWIADAVSHMDAADQTRLAERLSCDVNQLPRRYLIDLSHRYTQPFSFDEEVTPLLLAGQYDLDGVRASVLSLLTRIENSAGTPPEPFIAEVIDWCKREGLKEKGNETDTKVLIKNMSLILADGILRMYIEGNN